MRWRAVRAREPPQEPTAPQVPLRPWNGSCHVGRGREASLRPLRGYLAQASRCAPFYGVAQPKNSLDKVGVFSITPSSQGFRTGLQFSASSLFVAQTVAYWLFVSCHGPLFSALRTIVIASSGGVCDLSM